MKAIVTSIGEITTKLCVWSLERNGFEVIKYEDPSTLADKLKRIYNDLDEDFVRVDADVVVNRNLTPDRMKDIGETYQWWLQFECYGWHKQDRIWGGVQLIRKEALPYLRENVDKHMDHIRPETMLSRLPEFHNPRRFESFPMMVGIHGFAAKDIERVKHLKDMRNQYHLYDWELAEKLMELVR